jgi:hypothetical protein
MSILTVFHVCKGVKMIDPIEPLAPTGTMDFETFKEKCREAMNEWLYEYEAVIVKGIDADKLPGKTGSTGRTPVQSLLKLISDRLFW